jgi:hypothetical protein
LVWKTEGKTAKVKMLNIAYYSTRVLNLCYYLEPRMTAGRWGPDPAPQSVQNILRKALGQFERYSLTRFQTFFLLSYKSTLNLPLHNFIFLFLLGQRLLK